MSLGNFYFKSGRIELAFTTGLIALDMLYSLYKLIDTLKRLRSITDIKLESRVGLGIIYNFYIYK